MKRKKLYNDQRTVGIARQLNSSRQHVLGCLDLLWSLADDHADPETGLLTHFSTADIDQSVHHKGFAQAVLDVTTDHKDGPWLLLQAGDIVFPEFTEWNGEPAKKRGKDRKRKDRGKFSASGAEKNRNREEERKEEKANTASAHDWDRDVFAHFPANRRTNPNAARDLFGTMPEDSKAAVAVAVPEYAAWFKTLAAEDQRWAPGLHSFVKNGVYLEGRATWETRVKAKASPEAKWGWG